MKKRVLVLGVTGMLGHTLFRVLVKNPNLEVFGTARSNSELDQYFPETFVEQIRPGVDALVFDTVIRALAAIQPDYIINCIGLIKQDRLAHDSLSAITVNSQLPHRLSLVCRSAKAHLIHISTDCVFDGSKGNYSEDDPSDAKDLYGRSKFLGEVNYPHCVTIRTSIIGHELKGKRSLVEWFLAQKGTIKGFTKAYFTGFPTIELAQIINDYFISPTQPLQGLFHVASAPISKYDLLVLMKESYQNQVDIEPSDDFKIDRSLNASRFEEATGFQPEPWPEMIKAMHEDFRLSGYYS